MTKALLGTPTSSNTAFFRSCLLGTSTRTPRLSPGHVFRRKQEPLRGTPIRAPRSFGTCFAQKTRAPARNADPEDYGFFRVGAQKTRAPARNAGPNTTVFFRSCFPSKQKSLLGTLVRDGQLFSCVHSIMALRYYCRIFETSNTMVSQNPSTYFFITRLWCNSFQHKYHSRHSFFKARLPKGVQELIDPPDSI